MCVYIYMCVCVRACELTTRTLSEPFCAQRADCEAWAHEKKKIQRAPFAALSFANGN